MSGLSSRFLLYGSNGFVGDLIAREAMRQGLQPILAGRDEDRIAAQAAKLGLDYRVFALDVPRAIDDGLRDVGVVLNCAGPYPYTYRATIDGCLRTGTHYVDLNGDLTILEKVAALDATARSRGVMLLPAAGFDAVPSDCLAAHLQRRLPSASRLTLAFHNDGPARVPRGTALSTVELLHLGLQVRRNGRIEAYRRGWPARRIDFGQGEITARLLTWGDLFVAYHSTGIPNVEVYAVVPSQWLPLFVAAGLLQPLFRLPAIQRLLKRWVLSQPPGPTDDERARTRCHVWAEAVDGKGQSVAARLHGPEASCTWTTATAVAAVRKVLEGRAPVGFQTPSSAFGPDFVLECDGVTREDVR